MTRDFYILARKSAVGFLAFLLVFASTFSPVFMQPPIVRAVPGVPQTVIIVNPEIIGGITTTAGASVTTATAAVEQSVISKILNGLAWTVAKLAVQSITRSMVNWINSGFDGSPAFVSDLTENLQLLGDAVAEDFFNNLDVVVENQTGFNIRSPFQDQIEDKIREEYYLTSSSYGFGSRYAYTGGNVSDDPNAFIRGDFSKGGFNAWLSTSRNPQNNPFGAYLLATNELTNRVNSASEKRKTELGWGNGFLSWRGNCGTSGARLSPFPDSLSQGPDTASLARDVTISADGTATLGPSKPASAKAPKAPISLSQKDDCLGQRIKTPGSIIEDQLASTLGSGVRQLELADSINEIVNALLGQMVSQVAGAVGLSGLSQPSSGGGRSYLDRATDAEQYSEVADNLSDGFKQTIENKIRQMMRYRSNLDKVRGVLESVIRACASPLYKGRFTSAVIEERIMGPTKELLDLLNIQTAVASSSITSLEALVGKIASAQNTSRSAQLTAVNAITSEYQSLISGSTYPDSIAKQKAALDSSETTEEPHSLYSGSKTFAESCATPQS